MHHRVDAVLLQEAAHPLAVGDRADDEGGVEGRLAKAARQVVQDQHPLAARAQLQGHVTADVARAAGD